MRDDLQNEPHGAAMASEKEVDQLQNARERATLALIARLNDRDASVQGEVALALGRIGGERVIEALIAGLADPNPYTRNAAATAFGKGTTIKDPRTTEALIARLDDADPGVRRAVTMALEILAYSKDSRAIEAFTARLDHTDPDVRAMAARTLGWIGDPRATDALVSKLDDTDPNVRAMVASTLGWIGDPRAIESLIAKLDDTDPNVRAMVASTLGLIGDPRAIESLIAKLADPDLGVRSAVETALDQLGHPRRIETLIAWLDAPNYEVRLQAARSLGEFGSGIHRARDRATREQTKRDEAERSTRAEVEGFVSIPTQERPRNLIDMVPRLFAVFPTAGAALIGVLAAAAAVVILQPVLGNATGNPTLAIEAGAIAGAVGLLAYGGWRAAIEPDAPRQQADEPGTDTESARAAFALSNEALRRLVIESYQEGQHALAESKASSLAT